jgi:surfactin synthase thioesterase subunit
MSTTDVHESGSMSAQPKLIHVSRPESEPEMVIFGIGPAGTGAAYWNQVSLALPSGVELRSVRLPGRESRFAEPPHRTMAELVAQTAPAIADSLTLSVPYAFVGVCSGAAKAFWLAVGMADHDVPGPTVLVAVERPALIQPAGDQQLHRMPTEQLLPTLRDERMIPESVAVNPAVFALFEPSIRADFEVVETHPADAAGTIGCDILLAMGAESDPPDGATQATWTHRTTGTTDTIELAGVSGPFVTSSERFARGLHAALARRLIHRSAENDS